MKHGAFIQPNSIVLVDPCHMDAKRLHMLCLPPPLQKRCEHNASRHKRQTCSYLGMLARLGHCHRAPGSAVKPLAHPPFPSLVAVRREQGVSRSQSDLFKRLGAENAKGLPWSRDVVWNLRVRTVLGTWTAYARYHSRYRDRERDRKSEIEIERGGV